MDELKLLENLITEFYNFPVSKERRDEIGMQLIEFEKRLDSWKDCIRYIQNCNNVTTVTRNWPKLTREDKTQIQSSLSTFFYNNYQTAPNTLNKKLMKLLTVIARNEWSTMGVNFIPDIVNMIISDDSTMVQLGLSYLLIACEELLYPREELSTDRKLSIRHNFETHIPQLFALLNSTFQKFKCTNIEEKIYLNILDVYLQLFSWTPLSDVYSTEVLLPIFECSICANPSINTSALSVLNEILYKNCVPNKSIPIIITICGKLNEILNHLIHSEINVFNVEYITKILEMVNLLFSSHWHRIESNMEPSQIMLLLSSLFKLTFSPISLENYYTCLEIWCSFLEYLAMRNIDHIKQYENLLITLLQEVIKKLQTKIDDDEDGEEIFECTEVLQNLYLNNHANVIDALAELIPDKTFAYLFELWNSASVMYTQMITLERCAPTINTEEVVVMLSTFERAIQILTSSHSKVDAKMKNMVVKSVTDVTNLANDKCAYKRNDYNIVSPDLLRIHCELLMAVPVWLCSTTEKENSAIAAVYASTLPIIEYRSNHHPKLQIAAARLLSRLTCFITDNSILQPLFIDPSFKFLPKEAQRLLQCALCCWICQCKNESHEERLKFLRNLFEIVSGKNVENFNEMTLILKECWVNQSEGRELLFMSLEPWLEYVIVEYPQHFVNGNYPLCNILMTFFFEAFRVLLDHLKPSLIEKIIMMFEFCIVKVPFELKSVEKSGVDKMISFFLLLIQNPTYEEYTSTIISICCNISLSAMETLDVAAESNKLLCNILLNKWQYFYKGSQLNGKSQLNHKEELEKILEIILKSLRKNSDLTNYQNNLRVLEEINVKWNLYDKELFRVKFLPQFLDTLMFTLIDGMLNLADEILTAIYHMAAVNFEVFFEAYLNNFLMQTDYLTSYQKNVLKNNISKHTDMPSFIQTINQLTNDIRSFQRENGHGWWISYAIGARD